MSNSRGNDATAGFLFGLIIALTIGAFYRLLLLTIGIPKTAFSLYRNRDFHLHFMYYPAAALTIVALVMVFFIGVRMNLWMILYGLFIGWIAGDLKYYSDKWATGEGWLSWYPSLGYRQDGQIIKSKNDTIYTAVFSILTALSVIYASSPAFGLIGS